MAKHKHVYSGPWPEGRCLYCGRFTGLGSWELRDMPTSMAICPSKDAPRLGFWERIRGNIDCRKEANDNP